MVEHTAASQVKTRPLSPKVTEVGFNREQREMFFSEIREYIEEFTRLNPYRVYKNGNEAEAAYENMPKKEPPKTSPRINELVQRIYDHTTYPYPEMVFDDRGNPVKGTDFGGPNIVVAAIFERPPTVTVDIARNAGNTMPIPIDPPLGKDKPITIKPAPKDDIDFANRETVVLQDRFPASAKFNVFMDECKGFLKSPLVIEDGFGSSKEGHDSRRYYERGIKAALDNLGWRWSLAFQRRWDNLRLTKNNQSHVIMAFDDLFKGLQDTMSFQMSSRVKPVIEQLVEPMSSAKALREVGQFDASARELVRVARAAIENFAIEHSDLMELKEKRITRYQRIFLKNLFSILYSNRTVSDDASLMINQIDLAIKNKVYERLYPFLKAIIEYDYIDFEGIFNRVQALDESVLIPSQTSRKTEAMGSATMAFLLHVMNVPAETEKLFEEEESGEMRRRDFPSRRQIKATMDFDKSLIHSFEINDVELLKKMSRVIYKVTEEIVSDEPLTENSVLTKVFFRHAAKTGERRLPLTLDLLKTISL